MNTAVAPVPVRILQGGTTAETLHLPLPLEADWQQQVDIVRAHVRQRVYAEEPLPCWRRIEVAIDLPTGSGFTYIDCEVNKPFEATVEVATEAADRRWWPAVRLDHEGAQAGYYVRRLNINGQHRFSIMKAAGPAPLPIPRLLRHEATIPPWTYEAAEGVVFFGRDVSSPCHRVEVPEASRRWRIIRELIPPPHARDGGERIVEMLTQGTAHHAVKWYVAAGLSYAWLLEPAGELPCYLKLEVPMCDYPAPPTSQQGRLQLWALNVYGVTPDLFSAPQQRCMYNHRLSVRSWTRWYDPERREAQALAYLEETPIQAGDHEPLTPAEGWYLLRHPRPASEVD